MIPLSVVDDATVDGIKNLISRSLERGNHCATLRLCDSCKEINRQAMGVANLARSYQRKSEREKSSRKLSRLAIDVQDAASGLEDALRTRCLTPTGVR